MGEGRVDIYEVEASLVYYIASSSVARNIEVPYLKKWVMLIIEILQLHEMVKVKSLGLGRLTEANPAVQVGEAECGSLEPT